MNVIDNRKDGILVQTFGDLCIGDVYEAKDGEICIKTDEDRCIFFDGTIWNSIGESEKATVKLLSTTLEILGYRRV
jgi:hypothetical protein